MFGWIEIKRHQIFLVKAFLFVDILVPRFYHFALLFVNKKLPNKKLFDDI
jgi:hypothetical protein